MEAICSSETSVETQHTTQRHIPEDDVQSLYITRNTRLETNTETSVGNKEIHINHRVKQGCPTSPTLFNTFIDEVIRQWQDVLTRLKN
jgi:hypothetical protein